jgi:4-amino-4-deoxy-L-arabinose transferase-like glycosyltransferase
MANPAGEAAMRLLSGRVRSGVASGFGWLRAHPGALPLLAILLLAATLRLWALDSAGYGAAYYAAAVRSMGASWHNFLFNSFDPAGYVSLDKPPVAFWLQVLSTRLLGFDGPSLLLPQVLEGLAAIALLYHLVARRFGVIAGLLAALFLALTPVSVAVDRSANTDSAMVLVLLLAAWCLLRAVETGRWRWTLGTAALLGLAFNVKMLAALIVLPGFAAAFALGAALSWRRKAAQMAAAGVVLVAVSLSWVALFDLTPQAQRPYAGSSRHNSMFELIVEHNGLERLLPGSRTAGVPAQQLAQFYDAVPTGPLRLADRHLAGQALWLLPFAALGLLALFHRRAAPQRLPLAPADADIVLWVGWLLGYGAVFSAAGGIFHAYYLVALAPPLAALAGIGLRLAFQRHFAAGAGHLLLPLTVAACALWQLWIAGGYLDSSAPGLLRWLIAAPLAGAAAGLALLLPRGPMPAAAAATGMTLLTLLANPAAWAVSGIARPETVLAPAADIRALTAPAESADADRQRRRLAAGLRLSTDDAKLANFLAANFGHERFALATLTTRHAAPVILRSGLPVMAWGGYFGTDPILPLDDFAARAQAGEIRFVLLGMVARGDRPLKPQLTADDPRRAFWHWVRDHGRPVNPAFWRSAHAGQAIDGVREQLVLFDLHPEAGYRVAYSASSK